MAKLDVLSVNTNLSQKKISVTLSLDIEESSVSKRLLTLIQFDENKRNHDFDIEIDGRVIHLILKEWPTPNTPYLLKIQKGIRSIADDELDASFKHDIVFKSSITTNVRILTPANMEKIDNLFLLWEEVETELNHSYLVEVSKDNIFYDLLVSTKTINNSITLDDLPNGQYYIRVRTQKDEEYGPWSEIITFAYEKKSIYEEVIFEEELEIVSAPEMCATPETFIFEFDKEINEDDITEDNFMIIRRDF